MRRLNLVQLLLAACLAAGCATAHPQVVGPPVVVSVPAILTVEVDPKAAVVTVGARSWPTRPDGTIVEEFAAGAVFQVVAEAPGYKTSAPVMVTMVAGHMTPVSIVLERLSPVGRVGPVRLEGRAYADDGGPWNAFGLTYFPAFWLEKFDPERLDRNMKWASEQGADYFRVLSMVAGESWEDRTIDPRWSDYWDVVGRTLARAERHGLRLQVTIFAAADAAMPNTADRPGWIDKWAAFANQHRGRIIVMETANEYWQNDLGTQELANLTRRLNDQTEILVAPSAMACGSMPEGEARDQRGRDCVAEWTQVYATGAADLATPHFDRDIDRADGPDRPVRQPWEMLFVPAWFKGYINNEPIGPQSSVAQDDDPGRLSMAAATTWLARGAAYTLHTGAGVRAGAKADLARGRSANLWEVPRLEETMAAIKKIRAMLPASLPNCSPQNAHWEDAPLSVDPDSLVRAYQSVCQDGTFVALPHGIKGSSVRFTARRALEVGGKVYEAGQSFSVPAPSAVIVGRVR